MIKLRVEGWNVPADTRLTLCQAKVSGKNGVSSELFDFMERATGFEPATLSLGS